MGVLGCFTAWHLAQRGMDFTWSDRDTNFTAWKASTGAIYPSADVADEYAMTIWGEWAQRDYLRPFVERARWCHLRGKIHHGLRTREVESLGPISITDAQSLHLNVQAFVIATRNQFREQEKPLAARGEDLTIVAHGFNERCHAYLWGWSAHVRMSVKGRLAKSEQRLALYLRPSRFRMRYAYPIPGTDCWYAGSSLYHQTHPRPMRKTIESFLEDWLKDFEALAEGKITIHDASNLRQGWRPRATAGDQAGDHASILASPGRLVYPPLPTSGVRHAPLLMERLDNFLS